MLKTLQQLINDPQLTYIETLQELWSGYGEITRYYSPNLAASVIVKSISPPKQVNHPRGWHSDLGHQRKLDSYKIEAHFYQNYAHLCTTNCYVPQVMSFSKVSSTTQILVMEDLLALGFNDNEPALSLTDIKVVIHWLANFHARFINYQANDLWPVGTYWHLATRQDEFNTMENGPLKQAAHFIDNQLNKAKYQTLVHGDAKLANFCFGDFTAENINVDISGEPQHKTKRVAAVDFQYVGKGVGVKDLAYFLGSCLTDNDLTQVHNELLDYYFNHLKQACIDYKQAVNFTELETEWRQLYSFANADFHRFLQGWSPEHQKINSYLQAQTDIVLTQHLSS
ncbi:oxidoreductase family protein [Colwellia echini]|uniref:DUF1679 domain-containing protein n=1 Tax=Colwellia echini TaxID=1982103 RepID=A0ABY3MVC7_9GAMM|nr:oxidoreductase family protein [Colwellia echini]TYK65158.1 DUF1679 domain-containing protein [Colwellia echini]